MTHQTEKRRIWQLLEIARGRQELELLLRVIVDLAVIAKLQPKEFERLYKLPKVEQLACVKEIVEMLNEKKVDSLDYDEIAKIDTDSLQKIIYEIDSIEDFNQVSDGISEHYLESLGKRGGENVTSRTLTEVIKAITSNLNNKKVYDGAAGLGYLVSNIDCAEIQLAEKNKNVRDLGKNLLLLKDKNVQFDYNDSLLNPKVGAEADLVITEPPFGQRMERLPLEKISNSPFVEVGRGEDIPSSAGDSLWIQQSLYNLNASGKAIVVLPYGWLSRGGYDAKCREYLLDHDFIESIIALPGNILAYTSIPVVLLILNKSKADNKGEVRFIDAGKLGSKEKGGVLFDDSELALIAKLVKDKNLDHELLRVASLPEIHDNGNLLEVTRYVKQESELDIPDLHEVLKDLAESQKVFERAQQKLMALLSKNGSNK